MREWLFVIAPLTVVLYFLAFPDQLGTTMNWVTSATHWVVGSL
jgi:hypothetical protein